MKNGATYFKYTVILVIFLLVLWFLRDLRCNGGGKGERVTDTIEIKRDTTIYIHDTTISYVPKPYKVEVINDSIVYLERQPEFKEFPPIAQRWIEDYHTQKFYDTTITQTDEFGARLVLNIADTVYKNKITGKGIKVMWETRVIDNTITLREPPRVKGFIGLGIAGNIQTPFAQAEVSFGLLTKREQYWGIKGILQKDGQTLYGIEMKRLIKLKK